MAKTKGKPDAEPQPATSTGNRYDEVAKKIDAIRMIRADLVKEGKADTPSAVYEVYKTTKWTMGGSAADREKDINYISSTLSQIRKQEGGEGTARKPATAPKVDEPSFADLLNVKAKAKEQGGLDAVSAMVEQVATLADQVGGLDKLRKSIAALRQLAE